MTCRAFRRAAAAHALGALAPDEARACAKHLAAPRTHRRCLAAWDRAVDATAALAEALPDAPPPAHLWSAFERALNRRITLEHETIRGAADAFTQATAEAAAVAARARARRVRRILDVLALVARLVPGAARRALRRDVARLGARPELHQAGLALLGRPGTRVVEFRVDGASGSVRAAVDRRGGRAFVVSSRLPGGADRAAMLWVIHGRAAPVPAGFLSPVEPDLAALELDAALLADVPDALLISTDGAQPILLSRR